MALLLMSCRNLEIKEKGMLYSINRMGQDALVTNIFYFSQLEFGMLLM
jgi:hypothetical protein